MRSFVTSFSNRHEYTIILFNAQCGASKSIILSIFRAFLSSKSTLSKIYPAFIQIAPQLLSTTSFIIKAHMQVINIHADSTLPF